MDSTLLNQLFLLTPPVERLGWTLLHFLWQGLAVAFVVSIILSLAKHRSPNLRYLISLTALLMMAICPVSTFIAIGPSSALDRFETAPIATENEPSSSLVERTDFDETPQQTGPSNKPALAQLPTDSSSPPEQSAAIRSENSSFGFALRAVFLWLSGVAVLSLRLLLSWIGVWQLRTKVLDPPDWVTECSKKMATAMMMGAPVVRLSNRMTQAIALGFIKPMILLPTSWVTDLKPEMLEAIIAHELAHIRRCDLWGNLLQRVIETLLFYHPAIWWISNRIRVERELCCDAQVVGATQNPLRYAETLELVGRMCVSPTHQALAVSSVGSKRVLLKRIAAILGAPKIDRGRSTWLAGLIPLLAVLAISASIGPLNSAENGVIAADSSPPISNVDSNILETDSQLIVSVLDVEKNEPVKQVYFTLWKAMELEEEDPKNTVNGKEGFGYYRPVVWEDSKNDVRWKRVGSANPNDGRHSKLGVKEYQFNSLAKGNYRVTAMSYHPKETTPDPTPFGVSKPVMLDGTNTATLEIEFAKANAAIRLSVVDQESREAIRRVAIRLRDGNGMPIVHGHGNGNFFERTDDRGQVNFAQLPRGGYSVEIIGKRAGVNETIEYAALQNLVKVDAKDQTNELVIELPPRKLRQAEIDKRNPFSIFGRITDTDGNPIANAGIRAATGIGTLVGGGSTKTDADGKYKLYFGPGMQTKVSESSPYGVGIQAAQFYIQSDDWKLIGGEEYVFCLMTDSALDEFTKLIEKEASVWSKSDTSEVVFANQPKELNLVLVKQARMSKKEKSDGIIWGISRDGLVAGAKLLSATGRLKPGDPVVVQFVLKNESDTEQTVVLQQYEGSSPVLGANNRLELNLLGSYQQRHQHTLKPGEVLEGRQYRISVSTTGMSEGEYHITSGSAFWMVKDGKPNEATGIPFRKRIPFVLGDPDSISINLPPADKNPKTKIYWGDPTANLMVGMRLPKGRKTWPHEENDIEGQLFLFNAGDEPINLTYDLPPTPFDWNMHVTSREHNNFVRLDSIWYTGQKLTRTRSLSIKPGESVPVTGIKGAVSTGGKEAVAEKIGGPMLRILKKKTEFTYGDPYRLIGQKGRFEFHAALTINIEGLADPRVIASCAPVPFEIADAEDDK